MAKRLESKCRFPDTTQLRNGIRSEVWKIFRLGLLGGVLKSATEQTEQRPRLLTNRVGKATTGPAGEWFHDDFQIFLI
jgi:hypothetical protein